MRYTHIFAGRGRGRLLGRYLLPGVMGLVVAASAGAQSGSDDADTAALIQRYEERMEEMRELEAQLELAVRELRAARRRETLRALDDLAPLIALLESDDYETRRNASRQIRRALMLRTWHLIDTPELSAEADQRLRQIVLEAGAVSMLAPVLLEADSSDREAVWRLIDEDPTWVSQVLGNDGHRVQEALQHPPTGHDRALSLVQAALLTDHMRPLPQVLALDALADVSSPIIREAIVSLLLPPDMPAVTNPALAQLSSHRRGNWQNLLANPGTMPRMALDLIGRHRMNEAIPYVVGLLERMNSWNAQSSGVLVDALVRLEARDAAGLIYEQATRFRANQGSVWGDPNQFHMKPGDNCMWATAKLLGLDPMEIGFVSAAGHGWGDQYVMYGFVGPDERDRAFAQIDAVMEAAGPFDALPDFEAISAKLDQAVGPKPD